MAPLSLPFPLYVEGKRILSRSSPISANSVLRVTLSNQKAPVVPFRLGLLIVVAVAFFVESVDSYSEQVGLTHRINTPCPLKTEKVDSRFYGILAFLGANNGPVCPGGGHSRTLLFFVLSDTPLNIGSATGLKLSAVEPLARAGLSRGGFVPLQDIQRCIGETSLAARMATLNGLPNEI